MKNVARNFAPLRTYVALLHITDTARLLEVMKGDKKAIFTAASLATSAVDYLDSLQPDAGPGDKASPDPIAAADDGALPQRHLARREASRAGGPRR